MFCSYSVWALIFFFRLGRGCRQGDPISPYLFILCAEILSIRLRNNKNLKGINIDNVELKSSQYADDATAFLDGSKASLEKTLQELDTFANISGLKTNFDKTQVIWIGVKKYSTDAIKTRWKLSWGTTRFKLLGITFDVDLDKMIVIYYMDKIAQIKNSIKMWHRKFLTPLGKINVIKSLLLPQITHLLISLPNPDTEILNILKAKETLHFELPNISLMFLSLTKLNIAMICWYRPNLIHEKKLR